MSKLISNNLITAIPDLYSTEDEQDPICYVKIFTPDANWTWYITELSVDDGDKRQSLPELNLKNETLVI